MRSIPYYKTQTEVEKAFEVIETCNFKAAKGILFTYYK